MPEEAGYGRLVKDARFEAFLWAQFFATIVFTASSPAIAVVPFLLFAGCSGYFTDRFSKTRVLQAAMILLAVAALTSGRIPVGIDTVLLAMAAGLLAAAAYGILPELLPESQFVRANSLLLLATLAAIPIGFYRSTGPPLWAIALAAVLASAGIAKVPAAQSALQTRKPLALSVCGISWFWIVATLFLHATPLTGPSLAAAATGFGFGGIAAGALSGDYIELALIPLGLALTGIFSIVPQTLPGLFAIGCGAGLFFVPLNAYLQREAPAVRRGRILATNHVVNALAVGLTWIFLARTHANAGILIPTLGAASLLGAIVFTVRQPETIVRFVLWCIARTLFRIRLEGREHVPRTGGALLVSNHISYADAVLVGCTTRLRTVHFLMWQPIFDAPVANYFFRVLQAIPIDAASPKGTVRALRAAREQLERGELVGIFPEGSISRTGEIERFERGFEKILQGTGAPVIPIHIDGLYGHPLSCKGGVPFQSWEKLWRPLVTVRVGPPLPGTLTGTELREAVIALAGH